MQGMNTRTAKFSIGQLVKHRSFPLRGVVIDVDSEFSHGDNWWQAIPEAERPARDQPFYHVLAEGLDDVQAAYISEQNLEPDADGAPVSNPAAARVFSGFADGRYRLRTSMLH